MHIINAITVSAIHVLARDRPRLYESDSLVLGSGSGSCAEPVPGRGPSHLGEAEALGHVQQACGQHSPIPVCAGNGFGAFAAKVAVLQCPETAWDLHTIQYKSRYEQGALDVFATSFGSEEALARDPRHRVRLGGSEGPAESVPPRPSPQCTSASGARRRFELPPLSLPGACAAIAGYARTNAGQETTLARAGHASRPRPLSRKSLPIGLERV